MTQELNSLHLIEFLEILDATRKKLRHRRNGIPVHSGKASFRGHSLTPSLPPNLTLSHWFPAMSGFLGTFPRPHADPGRKGVLPEGDWAALVPEEDALTVGPEVEIMTVRAACAAPGGGWTKGRNRSPGNGRGRPWAKATLPCLGAYAAWDFWGHWRLKLSYLRLWDESEKPGLVCKVYAPNIDCQPSQTFNEVTLSGLRGGLLRTFVLRSWLRVGLGAGLSFNEVNASSLGENGEKADLLAPNAGHIGYLAMGSAEWIPFATAPLRIHTSVSHHWVDFNSCSGWVPPQYDPYCEAGRFLEMEVGAAVVF